ncbi:hypothetical protein KUTeg_001287 [Tegillarca granosa]|uniref:Uncharacterized protein n=1 Tax=Tegillarca granosa TaxID=220873 RepID=A0ABQ9FYS2_TEGGR|nr:hypothetical protein KUTeg_001287 [Tegillarca granosa]
MYLNGEQLRNCEVCDIHIPFLSYVNMSGMQDLHSILKSCKYVSLFFGDFLCGLGDLLTVRRLFVELPLDEHNAGVEVQCLTFLMLDCIEVVSSPLRQWIHHICWKTVRSAVKNHDMA